MIEKPYAAHLKTTLDAAAINVRKSTRLTFRSDGKASPARATAATSS